MALNSFSGDEAEARQIIFAGKLGPVFHCSEQRDILWAF